MKQTYLDNPMKIEKDIEKLSPKEYHTFTKGYLLALLNVMDHIVDLKAEIYNGLLTIDRENEQLQSVLKVLEAMEKHYASRANNLELELQTASR